MSGGLDRRAFLKNAGVTALAGAVGVRPSASVHAPDAAATPAKYDFDTPYNRFGTECTKYDAQIRIFGKDSVQVGMGIADMDFRAAPAITQAIAERAQHENWGYLDMPASFPQAIVDWNRRRYGIDIHPESLILTNGVHPGIIAALNAFSPAGSKVLMLTPAYDGFYGDLNFCRLKPEEVLMKEVNGRYQIDFDAFERQIGHDTNVFILCNPHNPTGNVWSPEDLTRLGDICLRHRVVVLADEIHCDFVTSGSRYTPFATLPNKDIVNNSITFKAASKTFSISAMKLAWCFSTNPDYVARVKANTHLDATTISVVANRAALTGGEDWANQCVQYIDGNHDFVESFIRTNIPLIKYRKAQGTYLTWLDVSQVIDRIGAKQQAEEANKTNTSPRPITPEQMVTKYFVTHAKVHINPGTNYGYGGAGHMRMNIATSRKTLEVALTNLASALSRVS